MKIQSTQNNNSFKSNLHVFQYVRDAEGELTQKVVQTVKTTQWQDFKLLEAALKARSFSCCVNETLDAKKVSPLKKLFESITGQYTPVERPQQLIFDTETIVIDPGMQEGAVSYKLKGDRQYIRNASEAIDKNGKVN